VEVSDMRGKLEVKDFHRVDAHREANGEIVP
jgi:hypothetical protein